MIADMIVISAVERAIENLKKNPSQLEFILQNNYNITTKINNKFGQNYIKKAMKIILDSNLHITPYYVLNETIFPSLAVISNQQESENFCADYGELQQQEVTIQKEPLYYENITNKIISVVYNDTETILTLATLNEDEVSKYYFINNVQIIDIIKQENQYIITIPVITPTNKFILQSSIARYKNLTIHNYISNCNTIAQLRTTGDIEIHRLWCIIIEYALHHQKLYIDSLGYQNIKISRDFSTLQDQENSIFVTSFNISGSYTNNAYIVNESYLPENIGISVTFTEDIPNDNTEDDVNMNL